MFSAGIFAIRQRFSGDTVALAPGQLTIGDFKTLDQFTPYDAIKETLADMMHRALRPEDGGPDTGSSEAARAQMEQIKQAKDTKQTIHKGATNDP
jgi:hypothetical protein